MGANGHRRVVITGLGAVTPLASDIATSWERLIGGRSSAAAIGAFDASGFPVRFACEAKEFEPTRWIDSGQARRMDRFAQLAVAAARQAEVDSGIEIGEESDRIGASVATAMGGMKSFEDCCETLLERGAASNPFSLLAVIPNGRGLGLDRHHIRSMRFRGGPEDVRLCEAVRGRGGADVLLTVFDA